MDSGGRHWQDESTAKGDAGASPRKLRVDHTHARHQRRIGRAIAERLSRVLGRNEEVLAFTEGIVHGGLFQRAVQGLGWAVSRRVALMFTDRRLVEIGLNSSGRRALGGIRSFPWDMVPEFELDGPMFELRTWADASFRWFLRDEIDPDTVEKLHNQADLSVSTYQPTEVRSAPRHYCTHCSASGVDSDGACGRCGHQSRTARLACALAAAFPGAGHLYAGRPIAASLRCVFELLVFGALAMVLLSASNFRGAVTTLAVGAVVIGLLKIHGCEVARLLAGRADMVSSAAQKRWRWLVPLGLLPSLVILLLPLTMIGAADDDISWDLDFLQAQPEWTGQRIDAGVDGSSLRSRWDHHDGVVAWIYAEPFRRFESGETARTRVQQELGSDHSVVQLGSHQVIKSVSSASAGEDNDAVKISLVVIDTEGRDLHTVSADVAADSADIALEWLESLVARGVWVAPTEVLGAR
jgi:hypothetical protein